jgi:hypothetical protein
MVAMVGGTTWVLYALSVQVPVVRVYSGFFIQPTLTRRTTVPKAPTRQTTVRAQIAPKATEGAQTTYISLGTPYLQQ